MNKAEAHLDYQLRRHQSEAYAAGADAMLDHVVKVLQRHIDRAETGIGPGPMIAKAIFAAADEAYNKSDRVWQGNPFIVARVTQTRPRISKDLPQVPKDPETGTEQA